MEIKLAIPARYIEALKHFAAKNDIRFYLNSICLEIDKTASRVIATDGTILGCFRFKHEMLNIPERINNVIIPTDLFPKSKLFHQYEVTVGPVKIIKDDEENIECETLARRVSVKIAGMLMEGESIDHAYPDYRKAVPMEVSGKAAQFDADLFSRLAKAWAVLHGKKRGRIIIDHNGERASLINIGDTDFVGIIMPLMADEKYIPKNPPEWFK